MYDSTSGTIQTQKDVEILLSNIIQERNILRAQNDHLWKVIERQKQIIQSLQDSPSPLKEINTSGLRENRKSSARKRTSQKVSDTEKAQLSGLPNVSKTTISSSSLQKVTSPNSSLHLDKKSFEKEALPALEREPTNSKRLSKNSSVDEIESSSTASPDKHDRRSYLAPSRNSTSSNPEDLINTVVSPRQSIARKRGATKVSLPPEEDRPASPRRPHHLADNLSRRGSTTTKSPNIDELLSAATPLADKLEDPAIKSTSEDDIAVLVYPQIRDIKSLKEYKISFIEMIIHQNKQSQEVPFLLFSVSSIKDPSTELYRVEKQYTDLFVVDMKIKAGVSHSILSTLAKFPDKSLFTGMGASNPLKESTRRQIVESFIDNLIAHVPEDSELVSFFTSGVGFPVIPAEVNLNIAGTLTKKGKGFGGTSWKNRYFALKSGIMECYEEKESPATTGTINLRNCTIIRSVPGHENEEEYAFAFVIFEYKKGTFTDGMTRAPEDAKVLSKFILHCVDEAEKLEWCRAIQGNIDLARKTSQLYDELRKKPFVRPYLHGEEQESKEIRHESETNMELIKEHQSSQRSLLDNPSFISNHSEVDLTAGSNMPTIIPRESSVSVQSASVSDEVSRIMNQKANQISFLTESASAGGSTDMLSSSTRLAKKSNKKRLAGAFNWAKKKSFVETDPTRHVFGVTLEQAVLVSKISDTVELPSVVYRCIEYLDAKNAINEEGIFRLSGTLTEIQKLKERFNTEGDVDLLSGMYDVHAIAGLLKLFLRELASPILTAEKQAEFKLLNDLPDRQQKVAQLKKLISQLPRSNYTLLLVLMGQLIRVVQNCAVNKMTVANVGIVFSPTLSVPPLVFTLMMSEYETIFPGGVIPDEEDEERRISVTSDIYTIGYRCIEFIEVKEGYKENAIFKLSGSATEIQKLRETFAKLGDVNLILPYNNYDIHNVAGLLKLWLKDLSPGLISTDMQSQFESLEEINDRQEKIVMIKKIIESAPKPNMRFLKVLLKMLRNVLNNGPTNNMPARAIASIFAPILCLSPALFGIMVSDSEYIFTGLETAPVENQVKEETVNVEPNDFVEPLSPNRRRKKPTDKAKREKLAQSFTSEEVQEIDESLKGVNGAVEIKIENTDEGVMNNSEERDEIIPQPPKMEQLDRPITGRARSRSINK